MKPGARLRAGLIGLTLLALVGTLGYVLIEGASPFDAFFMVMITITTVGFGEVFELSTAGELLTVGVMAVGVGLGFYTAGAGIEQLFSYGAVRQAARVRRMIDRLSDHVILCGFGRVGEGVWQGLTSRGVDVVVIEVDDARADEAEELGALVIRGNATANEALIAAGLERAKSLIACVRDDPENLVIVLSARALRADLHVVSRASELESESKLRLAGADRVVAPQVVGAERLAAMAVESELAEIFDVFVGGRPVEFAIEEVRVSPTSPAVGRTIREAEIRQRTGALILAVEDQERRFLTAPSPDHVLEGDTMVIVVGTHDQVEAAAQVLEA